MSSNRVNRPLTPAPNMHRAEISARAWFDLGGYPLLVESNHSGVLECAQEAFLALDAAPEPVDSQVRIRLLAHGRDEGEPLFDPVSSPPARYQDHDGLFSIVINRGNYAFGDLKGGCGFGYVTEELLADCAYLRWYLLEALAQSLLMHHHQLLPIHASCVVQDGAAVLIAGASGQGKSTLALSCVQQGLQFLSDDVVFLDCASDPLQAVGLARFARLAAPDDASDPAASGHSGRRLYLNDSWKLEVRLDEAYPNSTVSRATLKHIVLLAASRSASAVLSPIDPTVLKNGLDFLWSYETQPPEQALACMQRIASCQTHRLKTSPEVDQAAELIVDLFN